MTFEEITRESEPKLLESLKQRFRDWFADGLRVAMYKNPITGHVYWTSFEEDEDLKDQLTATSGIGVFKFVGTCSEDDE